MTVERFSGTQNELQKWASTCILLYIRQDTAMRSIACNLIIFIPVD
jgi:hypothetical protein